MRSAVLLRWSHDVHGAGETQRGLAQRFGVAESTVNKHVHRCARLIVDHVLPLVVRWPSRRELGRISSEFEAIAGLRGVVGAVDGSHIPVVAKHEDKMYYINRKGHTTVVLHAVVDSRLRFLHFDVGWPGSTHDARVFSNTNLIDKQMSPDPAARPIPAGCYLLGDKAYPLTPFSLTPFDAATTPARSAFNAACVRTRVVVERAFGRFKGMWRFFLGARYGVEETNALVAAAVVLHNLAIESRIEWADVVDADVDSSDDDDSDDSSDSESDGDEESAVADGVAAQQGQSVLLPPLGSHQLRVLGAAARDAVADHLLQQLRAHEEGPCQRIMMSRSSCTVTSSGLPCLPESARARMMMVCLPESERAARASSIVDLSFSATRPSRASRTSPTSIVGFIPLPRSPPPSLSKPEAATAGAGAGAAAATPIPASLKPLAMRAAC